MYLIGQQSLFSLRKAFLPNNWPYILLIYLHMLCLNITSFLVLCWSTLVFEDFEYITSWEKTKVSVPDRLRLWFCWTRLAQSCLWNRCDTEICHHESPDSGLERAYHPQPMVLCPAQRLERACQKCPADQTFLWVLSKHQSGCPHWIHTELLANHCFVLTSPKSNPKLRSKWSILTFTFYQSACI